MSDFYGLAPDEVPAFVGLGDSFVSFDDLPPTTRDYIAMLLTFLRARHAENPLAFEAVVTFLATQVSAANAGSVID